MSVTQDAGGVRGLTTRRSIVAATTGLVLAPLFASMSWAMDKAGHVQELRGKASAVSGATPRPLTPLAELFIGDLVRTEPASQLHARLGERTSLRLGESTEIRIDKYLKDAGGELELVQGTIGFMRTGPRTEQPLSIRSAYGLIAVRGTRFFAGPVDGAFGVFVEEGTVRVSAAGRAVDVGPGRGTDIAAAGQPPSRPAAWRPGKVQRLVSAVH